MNAMLHSTQCTECLLLRVGQCSPGFLMAGVFAARGICCQGYLLPGVFAARILPQTPLSRETTKALRFLMVYNIFYEGNMCSTYTPSKAIAGKSSLVFGAPSQNALLCLQ